MDCCFCNFKKNNIYIRIISLVIAVTFLFSTIHADLAYAVNWSIFKGKSKEATPAPPAQAKQGLKKPAKEKESIKKEVLSAKDLFVPLEYGRIVDRFLTDSPDLQDKIIIHIQDLHCNYEAQSNEAKIIEYLYKKYGTDVVALEGAAGECDTTPFSSFKTKEYVVKTAEHFLKKGQIVGAEYLKIVKPELPIKLMGVENKDLYIKHLENFRNTQPDKTQLIEWTTTIDGLLTELKEEIYSEELLELDKKIDAYTQNKLALSDYVLYLRDEITKRRVDTKGLDDFLKLLELIDAEKRIDFKAVEKEREELIGSLSSGLAKDKLKELLLKSLNLKQGVITQAQFYNYLKDLISSNNVDVTKYQNLTLYTSYITLSEAIDHTRLFSQINTVTDLLREKLFRNDGQRMLNKLYKNLRMIKGLADVSLTHEDLAYYKEHKKEMTTKSYVDFINRYKRYFTQKPNIPKLDLEKTLLSQDEFYILALERDQALIENTMKLLTAEKKDKKSIILITGGFHTEGITTMLKNRNIPYVVILPRVTKEIDQEKYKKVLLNPNPTIEELLAPDEEEVQKSKLGPPLKSKLDSEEQKRFAMAWAASIVGGAVGAAAGLGLYNERQITDALIRELKWNKSLRQVACVPGPAGFVVSYAIGDVTARLEIQKSQGGELKITKINTEGRGSLDIPNEEFTPVIRTALGIGAYGVVSFDAGIKSIGILEKIAGTEIKQGKELTMAEMENLMDALRELSAETRKYLYDNNIKLVCIDNTDKELKKTGLLWPGGAHYGIERPQIYVRWTLLEEGKLDELVKDLHHEIQERKAVTTVMDQLYPDWRERRRGEWIIEDTINIIANLAHDKIVGNKTIELGHKELKEIFDQTKQMLAKNLTPPASRSSGAVALKEKPLTESPVVEATRKIVAGVMVEEKFSPLTKDFKKDIINYAKENFNYDFNYKKEREKLTKLEKIDELIKKNNYVRELVEIIKERNPGFLPALITRMAIAYDTADTFVNFAKRTPEEIVIEFAKDYLAELKLIEDISKAGVDAYASKNISAHISPIEASRLGVSDVFENVLAGEYHGPISKLILAIKAGLKKHEIVVDANLWNPRSWLAGCYDDTTIKIMKALADKYRVKLSIHAPIFDAMLPIIGIKFDPATTAQIMQKAYEKTINLAADLGIKDVVFHVTNPDITSIEFNTLLEALKHARSKGVRLTFENTHHKGVYHTSEQFIGVLNNVLKSGFTKDDFSICIDLAHANLAPQDALTNIHNIIEWAKEKDVNISKIHLNQNSGADSALVGMKDAHRPIDDVGTVPTGMAVRLLAYYRFNLDKIDFIAEQADLLTEGAKEIIQQTIDKAKRQSKEIDTTKAVKRLDENTNPLIKEFAKEANEDELKTYALIMGLTDENIVIEELINNKIRNIIRDLKLPDEIGKAMLLATEDMGLRDKINLLITGRDTKIMLIDIVEKARKILGAFNKDNINDFSKNIKAALSDWQRTSVAQKAGIKAGDDIKNIITKLKAKSNSVFAGLSDENMRDLFNNFKLATIKNNPEKPVRIINEGDIGDAFYIIKSGQVRVVRGVTEKGVEKEADVAVLGAWNYFGEIALLMDIPRTASIVADSDTVELLRISKEDFLKTFDVTQDLGKIFIGRIGDHIKKDLEDLNSNDTSKRIKAVYELAKIADKTTVEPLIDRLDIEKNMLIRNMIVNILAGLKDERSLRALIDVSNNANEHPAVRRIARKAIEAIGIQKEPLIDIKIKDSYSEADIGRARSELTELISSVRGSVGINSIRVYDRIEGRFVEMPVALLMKNDAEELNRKMRNEGEDVIDWARLLRDRKDEEGIYSIKDSAGNIIGAIHILITPSEAKVQRIYILPSVENRFAGLEEMAFGKATLDILNKNKILKEEAGGYQFSKKFGLKERSLSQPQMLGLVLQLANAYRIPEGFKELREGLLEGLELSREFIEDGYAVNSIDSKIRELAKEAQEGYKAGRYERAYEAYRKILDIIKSKEDQEAMFIKAEVYNNLGIVEIVGFEYYNLAKDNFNMSDEATDNRLNRQAKGLLEAAQKEWDKENRPRLKWHIHNTATWQLAGILKSGFMEPSRSYDLSGENSEWGCYFGEVADRPFGMSYVSMHSKEKTQQGAKRNVALSHEAGEFVQLRVALVALDEVRVDSGIGGKIISSIKDTTGRIFIEHLEILTPKGWQPLAEWAKDRPEYLYYMKAGYKKEADIGGVDFTKLKEESLIKTAKEQVLRGYGINPEDLQKVEAVKLQLDLLVSEEESAKLNEEYKNMLAGSIEPQLDMFYLVNRSDELFRKAAHSLASLDKYGALRFLARAITYKEEMKKIEALKSIDVERLLGIKNAKMGNLSFETEKIGTHVSIEGTGEGFYIKTLHDDMGRLGHAKDMYQSLQGKYGQLIAHYAMTEKDNKTYIVQREANLLGDVIGESLLRGEIDAAIGYAREVIELFNELKRAGLFFDKRNESTKEFLKNVGVDRLGNVVIIDVANLTFNEDSAMSFADFLSSLINNIEEYEYPLKEEIKEGLKVCINAVQKERPSMPAAIDIQVPRTVPEVKTELTPILNTFWNFLITNRRIETAKTEKYAIHLGMKELEVGKKIVIATAEPSAYSDLNDAYGHTEVDMITDAFAKASYEYLKKHLPQGVEFVAYYNSYGGRWHYIFSLKDDKAETVKLLNDFLEDMQKYAIDSVRKEMEKLRPKAPKTFNAVMGVSKPVYKVARDEQYYLDIKRKIILDELYNKMRQFEKLRLKAPILEEIKDWLREKQNSPPKDIIGGLRLRKDIQEVFGIADVGQFETSIERKIESEHLKDLLRAALVGIEGSRNLITYAENKYYVDIEPYPPYTGRTIRRETQKGVSSADKAPPQKIIFFHDDKTDKWIENAKKSQDSKRLFDYFGLPDKIPNFTNIEKEIDDLKTKTGLRPEELKAVADRVMRLSITAEDGVFQGTEVINTLTKMFMEKGKGVVRINGDFDYLSQVGDKEKGDAIKIRGMDIIKKEFEKIGIIVVRKGAGDEWVGIGPAENINEETITKAVNEINTKLKGMEFTPHGEVKPELIRYEIIDNEGNKREWTPSVSCGFAYVTGKNEQDLGKLDSMAETACVYSKQHGRHIASCWEDILKENPQEKDKLQTQKPGPFIPEALLKYTMLEKEVQRAIEKTTAAKPSLLDRAIELLKSIPTERPIEKKITLETQDQMKQVGIIGKPIKVNDRDYRIVKEVGRGGIAIVYLAKDKNDNEIAIKVMQQEGLTEKQKANREEMFKREGDILELSKDISGVVDFLDRGEHPVIGKWIAMEYLDEEKEWHSLEDYLQEEIGILTPQKLRRLLEIFKNIVDAVGSLHKKGVIICDLKPKNIFIDITNNSIKLIDFGASLQLQKVVPKAISYTKLYASPEQLDKYQREISKKIDIYSLGLILAEMLFGNPVRLGIDVTELEQFLKIAPFGQTKESENIINEWKILFESSLAKQLPPKVYKDLAFIIQLCLKKSPDIRINTEDLIEKIKDLQSQLSFIKVAAKAPVAIETPELVGAKAPGQMKELGLRDPLNEDVELNLSARHKEFESVARAIKVDYVYGTKARVIQADLASNIGAYHFNSPIYGLIIVVNSNNNKNIQEEGRFHEAREVHWMGKGLSQHEAHVIASAEQVQRFSKDENLTDYHVSQLEGMSNEQLEAIQREDEGIRQWHRSVLAKANTLGADIDIEEIKKYEQKLRATASISPSVKESAAQQLTVKKGALSFTEKLNELFTRPREQRFDAAWSVAPLQMQGRSVEYLRNRQNYLEALRMTSIKNNNLVNEGVAEIGRREFRGTALFRYLLIRDIDGNKFIVIMKNYEVVEVAMPVGKVKVPGIKMKEEFEFIIVDDSQVREIIERKLFEHQLRHNGNVPDKRFAPRGGAKVMCGLLTEDEVAEAKETIQNDPLLAHLFNLVHDNFPKVNFRGFIVVEVPEDHGGYYDGRRVAKVFGRKFERYLYAHEIMHHIYRQLLAAAGRVEKEKAKPEDKGLAVSFQKIKDHLGEETHGKLFNWLRNDKLYKDKVTSSTTLRNEALAYIVGAIFDRKVVEQHSGYQITFRDVNLLVELGILPKQTYGNKELFEGMNLDMPLPEVFHQVVEFYARVGSISQVLSDASVLNGIKETIKEKGLGSLLSLAQWMMMKDYFKEVEDLFINLGQDEEVDYSGKWEELLFGFFLLYNSWPQADPRNTENIFNLLSMQLQVETSTEVFLDIFAHKGLDKDQLKQFFGRYGKEEELKEMFSKLLDTLFSELNSYHHEYEKPKRQYKLCRSIGMIYFILGIEDKAEELFKRAKEIEIILDVISKFKHLDFYGLEEKELSEEEKEEELRKAMEGEGFDITIFKDMLSSVNFDKFNPKRFNILLKDIKMEKIIASPGIRPLKDSLKINEIKIENLEIFQGANRIINIKGPREITQRIEPRVIERINLTLNKIEVKKVIPLWFLLYKISIQPELILANAGLSLAYRLGWDELAAFFARWIYTLNNPLGDPVIPIFKQLINSNKSGRISKVYYPGIGSDVKTLLEATDARIIVGVDPWIDLEKKDIEYEYKVNILACGGKKLKIREEENGKKIIFSFDYKNQNRTVILYREDAREYTPDEIKGGYDLYAEIGLPSGISSSPGFMENVSNYLNEGGLLLLNRPDEESLSKLPIHKCEIPVSVVNKLSGSGVSDIWKKGKAKPEAPPTKVSVGGPAAKPLEITFGARKNIIDTDEKLTEADQGELLKLVQKAKKTRTSITIRDETIPYYLIYYTKTDDIGGFFSDKNISGGYNLTFGGINYIFVESIGNKKEEAIAQDHERLELFWRSQLRQRYPEELFGFDIDRAAHILAWAQQIIEEGWQNAENVDFIKEQLTAKTMTATQLDKILEADRSQHQRLIIEYLGHEAALRINTFEASVKLYAEKQKTPVTEPKAKVAELILKASPAKPVAKPILGPTETSRLKILSEEQKAKVEEIFDKSRQIEIQRLNEKLAKSQSLPLEKAIDSFKKAAAGTVLKVEGEITLRQLHNVASSGIDFEFALLRIRGTNDWIIIKGYGETVDFKDAAPLYLFDIYMHNHPRDSEAIPSSGDLFNDFYSNIGNTTTSFIIAKNGMTRFDSQGIKQLEINYWLFESKISEIKRKIAQEQGIQISGELSPKDPLIKPYLIDMLADLKVQYTFKGWNDFTEADFAPMGLNLNDQLQSSNPRVSLRAIDTLNGLAKEINLDVTDVFGCFAKYPNEQIQHRVLDSFLKWNSGPRRDEAIRAFLDSKFSSIRKEAKDYLSIAKPVAKVAKPPTLKVPGTVDELISATKNMIKNEEYLEAFNKLYELSRLSVTQEQVDEINDIADKIKANLPGRSKTINVLVGKLKVIKGTPPVDKKAMLSESLEKITRRPTDSGLIGKWQVVSKKIEFIPDISDPNKGVIRFMAKDIEHPEKEAILIEILAERAPPATFEGYRRTDIDEINDKLEESLSNIPQENRFVLQPNSYGIDGIGTPSILAVLKPLKDNNIAIFHEVAHAAGLDLILIKHIKGGSEALDAYININKEGKEYKYRQIAEMRSHYAYRLFQKQQWPDDDIKLTQEIKKLQAKPEAPPTKVSVGEPAVEPESLFIDMTQETIIELSAYSFKKDMEKMEEYLRKLYGRPPNPFLQKITEITKKKHIRKIVSILLISTFVILIPFMTGCSSYRGDLGSQTVQRVVFETKAPQASPISTLTMLRPSVIAPEYDKLIEEISPKATDLLFKYWNGTDPIGSHIENKHLYEGLDWNGDYLFDRLKKWIDAQPPERQQEIRDDLVRTIFRYVKKTHKYELDAAALDSPKVRYQRELNCYRACEFLTGAYKSLGIGGRVMIVSVLVDYKGKQVKHAFLVWQQPVSDGKANNFILDTTYRFIVNGKERLEEQFKHSEVLVYNKITRDFQPIGMERWCAAVKEGKFVFTDAEIGALNKYFIYYSSPEIQKSVSKKANKATKNAESAVQITARSDQGIESANKAIDNARDKVGVARKAVEDAEKYWKGAADLFPNTPMSHVAEKNLKNIRQMISGLSKMEDIVDHNAKVIAHNAEVEQHNEMVSRYNKIVKDAKKASDLNNIQHEFKKARDKCTKVKSELKSLRNDLKPGDTLTKDVDKLKGAIEELEKVIEYNLSIQPSTLSETKYKISEELNRLTPKLLASLQEQLVEFQKEKEKIAKVEVAGLGVDTGLIGKWQVVSEIKFIPDISDPNKGVIRFMAKDIEHPEKEAILIEILAERAPPATFEGYRRTDIDEINDKLEESLSNIPQENRFVLQPNSYGIDGIGTPDILAVLEPLKDNNVAIFHELAHAAGLDLIRHIKGGDEALNAYINNDKEYRQAPQMQPHYAYRLFQKQQWPDDDIKLTQKIKELQAKPEAPAAKVEISRADAEKIMERVDKFEKSWIKAVALWEEGERFKASSVLFDSLVLDQQEIELTPEDIQRYINVSPEETCRGLINFFVDYSIDVTGQQELNAENIKKLKEAAESIKNKIEETTKVQLTSVDLHGIAKSVLDTKKGERLVKLLNQISNIRNILSKSTKEDLGKDITPDEDINEVDDRVLSMLLNLIKIINRQADSIILPGEVTDFLIEILMEQENSLLLDMATVAIGSIANIYKHRGLLTQLQNIKDKVLEGYKGATAQKRDIWAAALVEIGHCVKLDEEIFTELKKMEIDLDEAIKKLPITKTGTALFLKGLPADTSQDAKLMGALREGEIGLESISLEGYSEPIFIIRKGSEGLGAGVLGSFVSGFDLHSHPPELADKISLGQLEVVPSISDIKYNPLQPFDGYIWAKGRLWHTQRASSSEGEALKVGEDKWVFLHSSGMRYETGRDDKRAQAKILNDFLSKGGAFDIYVNFGELDIYKTTYEPDLTIYQAWQRKTEAPATGALAGRPAVEVSEEAFRERRPEVVGGLDVRGEITEKLGIEPEAPAAEPTTLPTTVEQEENILRFSRETDAATLTVDILGQKLDELRDNLTAKLKFLVWFMAPLESNYNFRKWAYGKTFDLFEKDFLNIKDRDEKKRILTELLGYASQLYYNSRNKVAYKTIYDFLRQISSAVPLIPLYDEPAEQIAEKLVDYINENSIYIELYRGLSLAELKMIVEFGEILNMNADYGILADDRFASAYQKGTAQEGREQNREVIIKIKTPKWLVKIARDGYGDWGLVHFNDKTEVITEDYKKQLEELRDEAQAYLNEGVGNKVDSLNRVESLNMLLKNIADKRTDNIGTLDAKYILWEDSKRINKERFAGETDRFNEEVLPVFKEAIIKRDEPARPAKPATKPEAPAVEPPKAKGYDPEEVKKLINANGLVLPLIKSTGLHVNIIDISAVLTVDEKGMVIFKGLGLMEMIKSVRELYPENLRQNLRFIFVNYDARFTRENIIEAFGRLMIEGALPKTQLTEEQLTDFERQLSTSFGIDLVDIRSAKEAISTHIKTIQGYEGAKFGIAYSPANSAVFKIAFKEIKQKLFIEVQDPVENQLVPMHLLIAALISGLDPDILQEIIDLLPQAQRGLIDTTTKASEGIFILKPMPQTEYLDELKKLKDAVQIMA